MVRTESQYGTDLEQRWVDLVARLQIAFEAAPVEDGETHEAEAIVSQERQLLSRIRPEQLLPWMTDEGGEFAWSLLRCLGRSNAPESLPPFRVSSPDEARSWRRQLLRGALACDDVRVRDGAVSALEDWGDPLLLDVFAGHCEPVPWLRDYIAGVESDLAELTA